MQQRLKQAVAELLGSAVSEAQALSGGDINDAFRVQLADGRVLFLKTRADAPEKMFTTEAQGLAWLAEPKVIRIPKVLAVSDEPGVRFLALEYLEQGPRIRRFDEHLGLGLAALHRSGATSFGHDCHNFIGRLPQSNSAASDWPSFYRDQRLMPQLERASRAGLVGPGLISDFDRLWARLPSLVGPAEPPARLHGDLWGGNLHVDEVGEPCLIDPAVYGGHREMDLAMMRLFGGFDARVFDAYAEAYPLAPGSAERLELYQLYPLLVHVNLFGGGYVGSVTRALRRYL